MLMKKRVLSIIFIVIMMFNSMSVGAAEINDEIMLNDESIEFDVGGLLDDIDSITIKNSITINGEKNNLYPTFDNPQEAIRKISDKESDFLKEIALKYSLSELSDENWNKYYYAISDYLCGNEYKDDRYIMLVFLSIYESQSYNDKILDAISRKSDDMYDELAILMPYNSSYCIRYYSEYNEIIELGNFNKEAAIEYAIKYATNPNYKEYGYIQDGNDGKDCTNFASQILENGGYNQKGGISTHIGWWHKVNGNTHTYSSAWAAANNFVKYIGVNYVTNSHFDFSRKLQPGDFIALDYSDQGRWSHIGFVTKVDYYVGDYGYYDYCVAQHSSDYHMWASHENNHWDTEDVTRYGVIRK